MNEKDSITYKLADLCHQQWSGWMFWLFKYGTYNEDGTFTVDADHVERWRRQMVTPFVDLSEDERDSDLHEASKFQTLLYQHIADLKVNLDKQLEKAHDVADRYREIGLDGIANTLNKIVLNIWYVFQYIMQDYEYIEPKEGR